MPLTVKDLIANPTLRTRLVAGERGVDRELTWAHSIEIPEPWAWLGNGELLMTTGHNFPAELDGQIEFIRRLDENGISGLALAERMTADLTPEAVAEADRRGFPLLQTGYEVPFVLVSRAVAESSARDSQLTSILRVYELYRQAAVEGSDDVELLDRISGEVGASLRVVDIRYWEIVVPALADSSHELPAHLREILADETNSPLRAITRVKTGGEEYLVLPIGDGTRFALVAQVTNATFDLVVLQHVSTVAAVQAQRRVADAGARLNGASRLLARLVSGSMDTENAWSAIADFGLKGGPWLLMSIETAQPLDLLHLQERLLRYNVPNLLSEDGTHALLLIQETHKDDALPLVEAVANPGARIGVSDVATRLNRLPDSAPEATWARQAVRSGDSVTSFYGIDRPLFLPGTVSEARAIVSRVLGVLIEYDREHNTDLLASLETYFDEKRSWQAASRKLSIHRQTLIYRMKRVEALTSRQLDDLNDLAELHLALRTWKLFGRQI